MRRIFLPLLLLACCIYGAITIDGRLDEPEWQTAKENKGFKALGTATNKIVQAQTSFKVISMEDRIYIGVKCEEPLMDKLKEITAKKSSSAIWEDDANKMDIKATLKGHKQRVIYMALGPDSRKIVTGAGDETVRFWDVFGYENKKYNFYNIHTLPQLRQSHSCLLS